MAVNIYSHMIAQQQASHKMLAVLIDPDKPLHLQREQLLDADWILIGGSTGEISDEFMDFVRSIASCPILLFPGNHRQFHPKADALLMLSLMNANDPEWLVGQPIRIARQIAQSDIEVLPMAYILVDGGRPSSVERVSHTRPIPQEDIDRIVDTAIAGELMGKKLIYLEAGSGAQHPVQSDVIRAVKKWIHVPLIVGGGIRDIRDMRRGWDAGADIMVIGNYFEQHPEYIPEFCHARG